MSVLVTGGAGFIGSHFIERLLAAEPDTRVVCLDNFDGFYDPARKRENLAVWIDDPRVTIVEGSITDEPLVDEVFARHDVRRVMHLAGSAGVRASLAAPLDYEHVNVRGTLILLEAVRKRPVERFALVSSSTVYGAGAAVPFEEDAPLGVPLSPYGVTKQAAESWAWHYGRTFGVPVVALRPFSVYGPRMRPDLAIHVFASAIEAGRPIPLFGDGTFRRDFTHVSDVCGGLLAALSADGVTGEAINLGHHEPVAMIDLIRILEQELGRKATIDFREPVAADMPVTWAELGKAQRLLGYRPEVSITEGIRSFVEWFRSGSQPGPAGGTGDS